MMKKIGILCAMDSEFALIRDALAGGHTESVGRQTFYVAEKDGKCIVAAVCGVGKVNAAACTQMLISRFGASCVINSGVSGALSPDLRILDLVIAREVTYHDLEERLLQTYFPHCSRFPADEALSKLAETVCAEQNLHCLRGLVVSGDQFVTDTVVKKDIISRTGGDTIEMEGAAVGHVCYLNEIPFTIIRCISDGADDGGGMDYDTFVEKAAHRCAGLTLALIEKI